MVIIRVKSTKEGTSLYHLYKFKAHLILNAVHGCCLMQVIVLGRCLLWPSTVPLMAGVWHSLRLSEIHPYIVRWMFSIEDCCRAWYLPLLIVVTVNWIGFKSKRWHSVAVGSVYATFATSICILRLWVYKRSINEQTKDSPYPKQLPVSCNFFHQNCCRLLKPLKWFFFWFQIIWSHFLKKECKNVNVLRFEIFLVLFLF